MSDLPRADGSQFALKQINERIALLEAALREKDKIQESLQESEKRYRRLFESARDGILILDADTGRIADVNPYLLELLGYSFDELCGHHLWELGVFKDIAASKEAFRELQANEFIRYEDLPLQRRDGGIVSVEFVSNVYLVDHERVIQCNNRDISARKRSESELAASEAKTRSILDNIGIGVALISPAMEVLELNLQMREMFPRYDPTHGELCYRQFNDPPRDAPCDWCPTLLTLRDGLVHEAITQTPHPGGDRDYRIVSSPIKNAAGEVTAAIEIVEDITEKLHLESQIRQAQKMEAVGQLAGGVAHDFNNMLSVILGYAELGLSQVKPNEPLHAELGEIIKAANRSAEITRQLLAFARKQTITPVVIDLNQTAKSMLRMLRRLIGEDIELVWRPTAGVCPVKMDPIQVDQILVNLCVNARDAISGVGRITIKTGAALIDDTYCAVHAGFIVGDFVVLTVSDDGCGMDRETIDHIFEPFITSKSVGQGTGLGLSTVYGIVKQNSGFINVYSEPGKGTTFNIYLPRFEIPAIEPPREKAQLPVGAGETVLLVEDEPSILAISTMMLERLGYRVLGANGPAAALGFAADDANHIQLLITDVIMPDMNGRELAQRVQNTHPGIRTLFMSGYPADVIADRGALGENVHFIQKPFTQKDMAAKVRAALH